MGHEDDGRGTQMARRSWHPRCHGCQIAVGQRIRRLFYQLNISCFISRGSAGVLIYCNSPIISSLPKIEHQNDGSRKRGRGATIVRGR